MQNMELGTKWQLILDFTQQRLTPALWEQTIHSGLLPLQLDNQTLQLGVMQGFIKNFVESNLVLNQVLLEAVHQILGPSIQVEIIDLSAGMPTPPSPTETPAPIANTNAPTGNMSAPAGTSNAPAGGMATAGASSPIANNTATVSPMPPAPADGTFTPDMEFPDPPVDIPDNVYIPDMDEMNPVAMQVEEVPNMTTPHYSDPVYIDKPKAPTPPVYPDLPAPQSKQATPAGNKSTNVITDIDLSKSDLNPDFTFENFISGNSTRVAFSLAQAVAESPSDLYNPLFIYGESGLGKTHLMHAIGNDIIHRYPDKKVMCITSEALVNTFVDSLKSKTPDAFRNTFRNIDVLLVDDIQFIEDKNSTQEEFFHTFNVLKNDKKQIVLTSDTLPKDMKKLTDRLRTRFEEGIITTIDPPDREMRTAILQSMIEQHQQTFPNLNVDKEVINFLVISFKDNIRSLKGALNSLLTVAATENKLTQIDLHFARQALSDRLPDAQRVYLTIEGIQDFISSYFNIKKSDLVGSKRNKQFVVPRQISMYLCRELINESFPQIGAAFGKDHTTILHAYGKVAKELEKDPALRDTVDDIKEKIRQSV